MFQSYLLRDFFCIHASKHLRDLGGVEVTNGVHLTDPSLRSRKV